MKNIVVIVLAIILNIISAFTQDSNCFRQASFGEKNICLPEIDGYQECYTDPIVKEIADATEAPSNVVLGYYLNKETYRRRDSIGLFRFDDYFKVYGTLEIQDLIADELILEQMNELLSGNFISKNWTEMSQEIDKVGLDVEIGVPIIIESYRIDNKSFTMILLIKYAFEGIEPYTLATTINGYLKQDRLIWMAYYLNYNSKETIAALKLKSNQILKELIEAKN